MNHYVTCTRLDKGLTALLSDLSSMPGLQPGKTLLDETPIVVTSEFGRTPEMNLVKGHDHWRFVYTADGPGSEGATGAETGKKAHFGFPNGPAPVGTYPANGFGLHDMTGNVWEWVSDRHERNYYSISPEKNPPGPRTGAYRIIRGGSWADSDERMLGVHYRNYADPTVKAPTIGVRCARSV